MQNLLDSMLARELHQQWGSSGQHLDRCSGIKSEQDESASTHEFHGARVGLKCVL